MGRRQLLELVVVLGYVVALVPFLWARRDVNRIPRSIWRYTAPRPRELWGGALFVTYLCGGWPGLLSAIVWRFSSDRRALREEWAHLHRRNVQPRTADPGSSRRPSPTRPASPDEPEIVLADYEALDAEHEMEPSPEDAPPPSG
jgi:hypothetical protein